LAKEIVYPSFSKDIYVPIVIYIKSQISFYPSVLNGLISQGCH